MVYAANGCQLVCTCSDDDGQGATVAVNTVSVGYTMGALAFHIKADDQATQNYDVQRHTQWANCSVCGTDEIEQHLCRYLQLLAGCFDSTTEKTEGNTAAGTAESELSCHTQWVL